MFYNCCDFVDLYGEPVERTKDDYPYSYDPFLVWSNGEIGDDVKTVYSDRLYQWDSSKFESVSNKIWGKYSQYFDDKEPHEIEAFLSEYMDKKIRLVAIMECCNHSSGFPYWRFCYREI